MDINGLITVVRQLDNQLKELGFERADDFKITSTQDGYDITITLEKSYFDEDND